MTFPEWYSKNIRRLFFDMHLPDWTQAGQSAGDQHALRGIATRFEPEQLIREFDRARINAVVVFAKCQFGNFYYNTQIGHKHVGLGDQDFLGEMIHHAHRHNIRVIAYYSNMWDTEAARLHPDWMAEEADGRYSYNRWPTMSLLSPYRDLVHAHLTELTTHYEIDGLWSDILSDLPSFDRYSRAAFEGKYGQPMPRSVGEAGWLNLIRWQQDMLYDYLEGCYKVVKSIRPEVAYIVNFYGTPYAASSQGLSFKHQTLSDMGSTEGYTEWQGLIFPGFAARYMRSAKLGGPFEILTGRFVHTWDFTVRPLAQMRFEAFSVVANGGAVSIDDEPYQDGRLEPVVYDHIENIYSEIERREPALLGAEPLRYAALYVSQKARELDEILNPVKAPASSMMLDSKFNATDTDLLPAWMGLYKALTESHIPVEIVDDRPESFATLSRYKVIYLSNILTLSTAEIEALRTYVANGGAIIATGATSLYDEQGNRLANFDLADLFGVDYVRRGTFTFPYLQFHDSPLTEGAVRRPLPHYTALWEVKPNVANVGVAATRRNPLIETSGETYYHNNQPPPDVDTGEPVVVYRTYGKGRVVYAAASPESNYARLGHEPYRRLIANMVTWAAGTLPPVRAEGLLNTEIVTNQLGGDLIVHLVTGFPQRAVRFGYHRSSDTIEEIITLHNVRLTIPSTTTAVYRVPSGESLPITRAENAATITIPTVEDWETLRLVGSFG
ncbi:MAG: beta-galactosidase trimerization domain-containing protein [Chloroflexi bacterium]|nr:beta-galactosidase trimerization domain-containing protein [Chloroflexota bacterium]MCC6894867.1 beta-galactosidase trimerization domain-containing protein [Anaerolineae bacterium]